MTDKEILDRYINLDNSCLTDKEKIEVRDLLYEYKVAFSFVKISHSVVGRFFPGIELLL